MKKYLTAALLGLGIAAASAAPASAQRVVAKMTCVGSYQNLRIGGHVVADWWTGTGSVSNSATLNVSRLLKDGRMSEIPGRIRLFGIMRDSRGRIVNFEVFLSGGNQGVGSVWINHMRHRETHMRLVLRKGGFVIYPETGGAAVFRCRSA